MQTPEGISAARVKSFTAENVARFFDIYEFELRKVNHPVHRVINLDGWLTAHFSITLV
jgi:hypothetical protein